MHPYRLLLLAVLLAACAGSRPAAIPLTDLSAFRPTASNWRIAGDVRAEGAALAPAPGTGVLVCVPTPEARDNLFTRAETSDAEVEVDVLVPQGSNSGIYLMGRYEVQVFDSYGTAHPKYSDMGGIYERWDDTRPDRQQGYEGHAPRTNAARPPGVWQHVRILFRAPRFDADGRKVQHARFERVELNGVTVHEGVDVTGPTRAAAFTDERPAGPLMLQGDHGPVAYRNLRLRPR